MTDYQPGDKLTWFPGKHPKDPREAVFIRATKKKAWIMVKEKDGNEREVIVSLELIEKARTP